MNGRTSLPLRNSGNIVRPFVAIVMIAILSKASAEIRMPALFADHMVLQQLSDTPVWGWAAPDEEVTVTGSWESAESVTTTAGTDGSWKLLVNTPNAGGPYTLRIQGSNEIVIQDVLLGEVWLCSGQSNMHLSLDELRTAESKATVAAAKFPQIRLCGVEKSTATTPQDNCEARWEVCSPETVGKFSAVAYYFGHELNTQLNVPIGLIRSSWGGTPIESWEPAEVIRKHPEIDPNKAVGKNPDSPQRLPAALYNAMIQPLIPYRIAGAIWYQGEANRPRPLAYRTLFPEMITAWRKNWGQGDFPFYFVQIAPFSYYGPGAADSAFLREAQMITQGLVPNAGMAVTLDIGSKTNIHPRNKQDVGKRLSLWALAKTYRREGVVCSGPVYREMAIENNSIRLSFDQVGPGLVAKDGDLTGFEIAGKDRKFVAASARIHGKSVLVTSPKVTHPVSVRYAFKNWVTANLHNTSGLPASSFRTDNWPMK